MLQRATSMAASFPSLSSSSSNPIHYYHSVCSMEQSQSPFFFILILSTLSLISLFLLFSLLKRVRTKTEDDHDPQSQTAITALKLYLSKLSDKTKTAHQLNPTRLPQSLLVELFDSKGALFSPVRVCHDDPELDSGSNSEENDNKKKKKKKKKRAKKKLDNLVLLENEASLDSSNSSNKEELVCLYPFTSSSSATQRKIKQQYDQLVKSHESKGLTLAQVGQFVNCLVDARNELQHKSECIKRKFTITKALLLKADRSSFDRLRQQINKLELEQKRLEEDAFVYNWLQHQLKLSPAYKRMVEIGACMELKAKSDELKENEETEQNSISFEEFLAQEKKDTFWQKHRRPKPCSG